MSESTNSTITGSRRLQIIESGLNVFGGVVQEVVLVNAGTGKVVHWTNLNRRMIMSLKVVALFMGVLTS